MRMPAKQCEVIIPEDIYGRQQEQWLQQAAGLAVSLGVRRGELLAVTVPDVDLDGRKVR